jgi:hypothetical protein
MASDVEAAPCSKSALWQALCRNHGAVGRLGNLRDKFQRWAAN